MTTHKKKTAVESPALSGTAEERAWLEQNWKDGQMMGMTLASNESVIYHIWYEIDPAAALDFEMSPISFSSKGTFIVNMVDQ